MFAKLFRWLIFLLVVGLSAWSPIPARSWAQASSNASHLGMIKAPTSATNVIFNQPINPTGILILSAWLDPDGSDNDQYVWDNFTLPSNAAITEIDWIGGYDPLKFNAGGPVVDFRIEIYPSNLAGEPAHAGAPLVQYMTGGNAGETSIGTVGGIPMNSYAFILPAAFNANAGEKYWVQIEAYQHGINPDWGIAGGTGGEGSHFRRIAGAGGDIQYRWFPGDTAFSLSDTIPGAPTDISLSNDMVDENQPVNSLVGALTATSPDPGATFTYSKECTIPGPDDLSFNISGENLQTSASFDFETQNIYEVCVRVADQVGRTFDKNLIISVNDLNEAPTGISLSNSTVDENKPVNSLVGNLSASDPDAGELFTFNLSCGTPGVDDGAFNISGTSLRTSAIFDYETKAAYNICVRVTDKGGLTFDKDYLVNVNNLIEPTAFVFLPVVNR